MNNDNKNNIATMKPRISDDKWQELSERNKNIETVSGKKKANTELSDYILKLQDATNINVLSSVNQEIKALVGELQKFNRKSKLSGRNADVIEIKKVANISKNAVMAIGVTLRANDTMIGDYGAISVEQITGILAERLKNMTKEVIGYNKEFDKTAQRIEI